jgi:hypothetical protein
MFDHDDRHLLDQPIESRMSFWMSSNEGQSSVRQK